MRLPALIMLSLLAACDPPQPAEVPWSNYHPTVKERIDNMALDRDCAGLQGEFDIAVANNLSQRARTGSGNLALMDYIDRKLEAAGCYQ